jgi:hypothetical protein
MWSCGQFIPRNEWTLKTGILKTLNVTKAAWKMAPAFRKFYVV